MMNKENLIGALWESKNYMDFGVNEWKAQGYIE